MPIELQKFPVVVQEQRVSFHDGFGDTRQRSGYGHSAIDIGAPRGHQIVAACNGRVVNSWVSKRDRETALPGAGWSNRGGHIVLILDGRGYAHYYAHMNAAPRVRPGQTVAAGALLGEVGNTGSLAAGSHPHLHYQVWLVGGGREEETTALAFTRPFGRSVNPYSELARLAEGSGATMFRNGGVVFNYRRRSAR